MRLTIIQDDGTTRIAQDAEGNIYAGTKEIVADAPNDDYEDIIQWWPIEMYSVLQPGGAIDVEGSGRDPWPRSVRPA